MTCVYIYIYMHIYIYMCVYKYIYIWYPLEGKPIPKTLQNCPFKTIPKKKTRNTANTSKSDKKVVFFFFLGGYHTYIYIYILYIYIYQWVNFDALWWFNMVLMANVVRWFYSYQNATSMLVYCRASGNWYWTNAIDIEPISHTHTHTYIYIYIHIYNYITYGFPWKSWFSI